jgi:hypothetical protein
MNGPNQHLKARHHLNSFDYRTAILNLWDLNGAVALMEIKESRKAGL